MKEIAGKAALVTGASRGLGPRIARALARSGMDVVVTARSGPELERVAESITGMGARAVPIAADIATEAGREAIVEGALAAFGAVAVLINNAGIEDTAAFDDQPETAIARIIEVNLIAPMLLTRAVLPGMLERSEGHIVNMASLAGKVGLACNIGYSASKGGLIQFTEGLRAEYRGRGVSASAICPGFVEGTGMYASFSRETGVTAPTLAGTTRPAKVANAVIRAIRRDTPEIIVNPGPMRLVSAFAELSPGLFERASGMFGANEMFRAVAEARKRDQR